MKITSTSAKTIATQTAGPYWIRIHEALDEPSRISKHRYFISVNLKLRAMDAVRRGGWLGLTKAEAIKDAQQLTDKIASAHLSVERANSPDSNVLAGIDFLRELQAKRLNKLLERYSVAAE